MNDLDCDSQYIIKEAWRKFVREDIMPGEKVRPEIKDSWMRSKQFGVNPYLKAPVNILNESELAIKLAQNANLINASRSAINNLYKFVRGYEFLILLTAPDGYILEVVGDEEIEHDSHNVLSPGVDWSEQNSGTNAMGTPLSTNKPVQIYGYEHYCIYPHHWAGSGAPIHSTGGEIIGTISIAGRLKNVHEHTLGMVVTVAHAIEMQLSMQEALDSVDKLMQYRSAIIESISEGLVVINSIGQITMCNKLFLQMCAKSEKELLGTDFKQLFNENYVREIIRNKKEITDYLTTIHTGSIKLHCTITIRVIDNEYKELVVLINQRSRVRDLAKKIVDTEAKLSFNNIIGVNQKFRATLEVAKAASVSNANVLLLGESGTGKDIFAQAIHNASFRKNGPFIAINCGAIPKELIASELFGYVEGAFTGASKGGKTGKFEIANNGTLFLDEIGEMPIELQTSLLRVIENKVITRVGGYKNIPIDVRIIAATNKDLSSASLRGEFRKDLFYRLNVLNIKLLPLRERKDDIKLLAEHFLKKLNNNEMINYISEEIWELLMNYDWPGNIRELQNVLERIVILSKGNPITSNLLPSEILIYSGKSKIYQMSGNSQPSDIEEAKIIKGLLDKNHWNITKVSNEMGIARSTLYRKIYKYNLKQ